MESDQLCKYCSQIEFSALATPTLADIHRARESIKKGIGFWPRVLPDGIWRGPKDPPNVNRVNLGSFTRIERDADQCKLCAVIVDAVHRQGGYFAHDKALPKGDEVNFWADPCLHYGHITDSPEDIESSWGESYFKLRRLSIVACKTDTGDTLAYFDNIVQPCNVGASKSLDLLESHAEEDEMLFLGRKRALTLDMNMVRRWMAICESAHGLSCYGRGIDFEQKATFRIRFIDVNKMCVCLVEEYDPSDPHMAYAALSYVWGQKQKLMLSAQMEPALRKPGSISDEIIPKTISDAISVARSLSLPFLWVDAICIMQGTTHDDTADKKEQIGNMANIYKSAYITIVAAHGEDADAGLAGLRPETRSYQQQEVVVIPPDVEGASPGLSLLTTCKTFPKYFGEFFNRQDEDADISTWNTRGWTLQERALSRRNLIFTREQVLWACDGAYFCEESCFEHPVDRLGLSELRTPIRFELFKGLQLNAINLRSLDGKMARATGSAKKFWDKYRLLVKHFSTRLLSFPGDVHDAFLGIIVAMQQVREEAFHWGHPRSRFELSLSWSSFHTVLRRNARSTLPMTSMMTNVEFPTWSWMGWVGEANVSVGDERSETDIPIISCFAHKSHPLRLVMLNSINEDGLKPHGPYDDVPWIGDDIRSQVTIEDIEYHLPITMDILKVQRLPDEHVLFFWASTATFNLSFNSKDNQERTIFAEYAAAKRPVVKDSRGVEVGECNFMSLDTLKEFSDSGSKAEFVAVGRRHIEYLDLPAIIIALQIKWVNGIATRLNYAEIEESAWLAAGPNWGLIALG